MLLGSWWSRRREELLSLAARVAPVYVMDEERLNERIFDHQALSGLDCLYHVLESNSNPTVLEKLHSLGVGFICRSQQELLLLKRLFTKPDSPPILFAPSASRRSNMELAAGLGAGIVLDNPVAALVWPDLLANREVFAQLNVLSCTADCSPGASPNVARQGRGASLQQLSDMQDEFTDQKTRLRGLVVEMDLSDEEKLREVTKRIQLLTDQISDIDTLMIGATDPDSSAPDLVKLEDLLDDLQPEVGRILLHTGSHLLSDCGVLLLRVLDVENNGARSLVTVQSGYSGSMLVGSPAGDHPIVNLSELSRPEAIRATLLASGGEGEGILVEDCPLPRTQKGDILLIASVGAYGQILRNPFTDRPLAAEHFLKARAVCTIGSKK